MYEAASTNAPTSGASTPKASEIEKAREDEKATKHALSVFKSIQRYQAVNPGSGEIILPSNSPPHKGELASEELVLEHIHGYRTRDVSNNAFYLSEDIVVFPAAAVGVVMDIKKGTQKHFHGRHKQEIATLSIHPSKRLVVTGDVVSSGDGTYLYIWDPKAPEDIQRQVQIRVGEKRLARGVADVCFSSCGKFVIAVSMDETHTIYIYNWQKAGKFLVKEAGHSNTGPVLAVRYHEKLGLISGGRDGYLVRQNLKTYEIEGKMLAPSSITSIDIGESGRLLIGMEGSNLIEMKEFGPHKVMERNSYRVVVEGHSVKRNQEVWGCATNPSSPAEYVTAGDDSMIFIRNIRTKETISKAHLQGKLKSAAYSPDGKYIAVGNDNGDIFILKSPDLTQVHFQKYDQPKDIKSRLHCINVLKFSPNGKYVAAGTHDDNVYVWQLSDGFKLALTLKGHTSYVTHLDWSVDSDHIQSNSSTEILCWSIPSGTPLKTAPGVHWSTSTCTFFESTIRGNDVTTVDRNPDQTCFVSGDDFGTIKLFSSSVPMNPLMPYKQYMGHGSNVTNVVFDCSGKYLVSTGGGDGCAFEWRVQKT
ncbi:Echinoderm microtubule-associated protein-like 5 [Podochytrium sp. JEL0797]|nr:Echinoderm microtubule-associated protein-like 5 [Podochytrium sp. JEL0797]